jgi:vitamin B12 transporter
VGLEVIMPSRLSVAGRVASSFAALVVILPAGARALHAQEPDPVELEGLVVTATAIPLAISSLGGHVTVLDGEELRTRGVYRLSEALREVPGIAIVQNGSMGSTTSVFMRGGESDYVQVLIDGVQVNQPGGSFDFSGLDMASVERIEVVRGPSSALNGSDAVAGVIHIITRGGGGERVTARTRAGSFGRLDATMDVSGGSERASYGVTLARQTTEGILAFNNAFDNTVLNGKASFQLNSGTRARISARVGDRRYRFPTSSSGALEDVNQFSFNDESTLSAELERTLWDGAALRVLATSYSVDTGTDDAPDGPDDNTGFFGFQSLDNYRRTALDLRLNAQVADGLTLSAGGEYESQEVRSFNESLSEFGPSTGRSANSRLNRAGYLHAAGERGLLSGNVGFRFEDNEFFGGFFTWQAGVSARVSSTVRLRASAGRGIKEPTFFEAFASGFALGNPDLDPEISDSWEAGAEFTPVEGLTLQATWFNQDFQDLIQFTFTPPQPGDPNYFNIAAARASGVEAGASYRAGIWSLGADVTWLDTEVTDSGFDSGEGATFVEGGRLLRRPEVTLGVRGDIRPVPALNLGATVRRFGDRDDRDFTTFPAAPVVLEAYTRVDASVSWDVFGVEGNRPGFRLTGLGQNLTDEDFQEVFGFRAPGRILTIAGELTFGR